MKLDFEAIWESVKRHKIAIADGGLILLGVILFASDRISGWWSMRKIDKLKANVNASMKQIEGVQANIAKEKLAEAAALERVKIETNEYLNAINATDAAKAETNRALSNMQSAVNANRNVGITAAELEEKLRQLNQ